MELQAKQLLTELRSVEKNIAGFAASVTLHGEKAGTGFVAGIKSRLSGLGSSLTGGLGALGIGVGVGATVGVLKDVIDKAHEIHHEAERFGLDAEQLQLIGNAAREDGIELSGTAKAMNLLQINGAAAAQGTGKQAEALTRLGISSQEFLQASPAEKFLLLADAYKRSSKDAQSYADAATLIGKRNTELIPILEKGRAEIEKQGHAMGVISNKSVKDLDGAYKTLQIAQGQLTKGAAESASGLKTLYDFLGKIADKTPVIEDIRRNLAISGSNLPASELAITPPPEALAKPAPPPPTPIENLPLSPDATQEELANKYLKEQGITDASHVNLGTAAQIQSDTEDARLAALQSGSQSIGESAGAVVSLENIRAGELESQFQADMSQHEMSTQITSAPTIEEIRRHSR